MPCKEIILLNSSQRKIKEILLKIENYQSLLRKKSNKKNNGVYYGTISICAIFFIFSLILIGIGAYSKNQNIILTSLILLLVSEIFLLVSTLVEIYNSRKSLCLFFKSPSFLLLRNADINVRSKIKFLPELIKFNEDDLELSKREIIYEKEHFDRRTSIITGTIDKIGIFPTILATLVLILNQLSNINVQNFLKLNPNFQFYFYAIIFIVTFFQIISMFNNFTSLKLSNMVDTLDYTINIKKSSKS